MKGETSHSGSDSGLLPPLRAPRVAATSTRDCRRLRPTHVSLDSGLRHKEGQGGTTPLQGLPQRPEERRGASSGAGSGPALCRWTPGCSVVGAGRSYHHSGNWTGDLSESHGPMQTPIPGRLCPSLARVLRPGTPWPTVMQFPHSHSHDREAFLRSCFLPSPGASKPWSLRNHSGVSVRHHLSPWGWYERGLPHHRGALVPNTSLPEPREPESMVLEPAVNK